MSVLGDIGTALLGLVAAVAVAVFAWRGGRDKSLDEREESERVRQDARIKSLEERVGRQETHSRIQDDYIRALRHHIDAKLPPPPPPWPRELGGA